LTAPASNLREEAAEDEAFLRRLFFANREAEFAPLGLPPAQLEMMLGIQFNAQHGQFRAMFPDCDWRIVEHDGEPIGRIYVARLPDALHLVDIALLPSWSGKGIGSALLDALLADAAAARLPVSLTVRPENPARRLYLRKGFVDAGWHGVDLAMVWNPA
jgi:ribosomal protein S18 acetylase RimI-like enzyme